MPKFVIHHGVLHDAANQLFNSEDELSRTAGRLIRDQPEISTLGAIGPDLFFWAPDYSLARVFDNIYRNLSALKDAYDALVGPLEEAVEEIDEAIDQTLAALSPHAADLVNLALDRFEATKDLFEHMMGTGLLAGVIEGVNFAQQTSQVYSASAALFNEFRPPLQSNQSESEWYWYDMLHYRRTGEFARNLIDLSGSGLQMGYSLGYLSHIATDLVGHGFVNSVVGGPYRLHVQRHATVENFMDTMEFANRYDQNIINRLHDQVQLPAVLPNEIATLLHDAFRATYDQHGIPHPTQWGSDGFLSVDDIIQTHATFMDIYELMGKTKIAVPEEPFEDVLDVLNEALADLLEGPPQEPSYNTGACGLDDIFGLTEDSEECYENFFENAETFFNYLGNLVGWMIETLQDVWDLIATALMSGPVSAILAALYMMQLLFYDMYLRALTILALVGFIYPPRSALNTSFGTMLTTPSLCCMEKFPRAFSTEVSHLVCPIARTEGPGTTSSFDTCSRLATQDTFIRDQGLDLEALGLYADRDTPQDTRDLYPQIRPIGNAIDLTAWMINTAIDPDADQAVKDLAFTNWNLDADRGYGYKTWRGTLPLDGLGGVGDEEYI